MKTLWKNQGTLHPTFAPINGSLAEDWFLLPHELRLQHAHAKALVAAGVLRPSELESIQGALKSLEEEFLGRAAPASDAEDLHTWVESELTARVGEPGRKIHAGRSRNDQVATLLVLFVRAAGDELAGRLEAVVRTAATRGTEWSDLAFPLQTHAQFAAPGSVGAWVVRFAVGFQKLGRGLAFRRAEWQRECPLGSGAIVGSSIPLDRAIQASELDFDAPSPSAIHSTTGRDECLDLLEWCSRCGLLLQSLAADVLAFSQTPFGWTTMPAGFGTGSSMMPNKTNPDAMELLRGESNALVAAPHHAALLMKGLTTGYQRDLQCIKPLVRDVAQLTLTLLDLTDAFLADLQFDRDRLQQSLQLGQTDATLRMEEMVAGGTPLREAHHAVASQVQADPSATPSATPDLIHRYRTLGSASPAETRRVASMLLESSGGD